MRTSCSGPLNIIERTDLTMTRPLICVSTDSTLREGDTIRSIVCPKSYPEAVAAAGGLPLLCGEVCAEDMADACDALMLSGGSDISPSYFGEEVLNDTVKVNPDRDAYEMALTRAFLERQKPILAICRGFQIVNVVLGGDLYQDLAEQKDLHHLDRALRHPVRAEADSVLGRLYGTDFHVNSTHHQAVRNLGEGLRPTAWSPEGLVEAYEHTSGLIWGTQFHPERLTGPYWDDRTPDMNAYFAAFVQMVRAGGAE